MSRLAKMFIFTVVVAFVVTIPGCGIDDQFSTSKLEFTTAQVPPSQVPPEVPINPPEGEPVPPVTMTPPSVTINVNVTVTTYIRINGGVKGRCHIQNKGTIQLPEVPFDCGGANVAVVTLSGLPAGQEYDLSTIFTSEDGKVTQESGSHKFKT